MRNITSDQDRYNETEAAMISKTKWADFFHETMFSLYLNWSAK